MTETALPAARLTPKKLYRIVAIAEAITWTLLITGLILRATMDLSIAVTIGGSIHGFVFLAYGATAILTAINQRWSVGLGPARGRHGDRAVRDHPVRHLGTPHRQARG